MPLPAIIGAIVGFFGWIGSLPDWIKYFIFIGGLALDAGIAGFLGSNNGVVGTIISYVVSNTFGIQGLVITSFHILIIATIFPLVIYLITHK